MKAPVVEKSNPPSPPSLSCKKESKSKSFSTSLVANGLAKSKEPNSCNGSCVSRAILQTVGLSSPYHAVHVEGLVLVRVRRRDHGSSSLLGHRSGHLAVGHRLAGSSILAGPVKGLLRVSRCDGRRWRRRLLFPRGLRGRCCPGSVEVRVRLLLSRSALVKKDVIKHGRARKRGQIRFSPCPWHS